MTFAVTDSQRPVRVGRPASTTAHALAAHAQRLFVERGFDHVGVDDIAASAGISRRTFFRYFGSKADVVWVESDAELAAFRAGLAAAGEKDPVDAIAEAFVAALDHGSGEDEWARHRAQLILAAPAVQAHATEVYGQWRAVVRDYVTARCGAQRDGSYPIAVAHAVIAASTAAHELWLTRPETSLAECMRLMFAQMLPR
ncbi:TetR family transcriptional regulator [Tomitella fengzijianii]|uniref:TetR family transcriptional regulator n=1 Tax=Tomitella fengzijianii TaxID=2597660 RepID=A0A516X7R9_9ACTN|nr:TetR family transcriptional regulator [Tomitella fengzijianii]